MIKLFLILFILIPSVVRADITTGLTGWYKFDGNIADSGSAAINGTTSGTISYVIGRIVSALYLQGNATVGSFGSNVFPVNVPMTISAWIYPLSTSRQGIAATRTSTNGFLFVINRNSAGNLSFLLDAGGTTLEAAGGIVANKWQHVCVTYTTSSLILYVNGASVGSNGSGTQTNPGFNGVIGADQNNGTNPFNGYMDDFRVYNRALTAADVLQLYNQGFYGNQINNAVLNNSVVN